MLNQNNSYNMPTIKQRNPNNCEEVVHRHFRFTGLIKSASIK